MVTELLFAVLKFDKPCGKHFCIIYVPLEVILRTARMMTEYAMLLFTVFKFYWLMRSAILVTLTYH
jgi:hypothetical protein